MWYYKLPSQGSHWCTTANEIKYGSVNTDLFVMSVILGTQCDRRHEDVEKRQDYVLGKVRLQATEIIAPVKNYYSRKKDKFITALCS